MADPATQDPRAPRRHDRGIALALAAATFAALAATESSVGFTRDEGYYFRAGESYAAWFGDLWDGVAHGTPFAAFSDAAIARRFEYNHEHPVLMKNLFGLSHRLFSEKLGWLRDAAGYRLPAWAVAGLLSALLFLMTSRLVSRRAGLFAVAAFWLTPRQFFHAHLAAFDMPMACAWLLLVYCYWRSLSNRRWLAATGVAFGLALAVKHNAWIVPGVLLVHWALTAAPRAWREGRARALARSLAPFGWMAVLGPLVFLAHWPWLWHHTFERIGFWISFHSQHINYPWEYFGRLLVEAPFPAGYAFGLTAVTVPLALLVLMATGVLREMAAFAAGLVRPLARLVPPIDDDSLLLLGNALASLVVLSVPSVPVFGGVKHWLPSMPFLAVLAARAFDRASATAGALVPAAARRIVPPGLAALVLVPGLLGVAHNHPWGTSFYNELAGGYPGGATLGMHRQYWSNNVTGVLPWLNANAPAHARVFFHEVNWDSFVAYRKAGMIREDIQYEGSIANSTLALYQYMPEFRDIEFQIWNLYGTQTPVYGLYLDETPQIVVYRRPGQ